MGFSMLTEPNRRASSWAWSCMFSATASGHWLCWSPAPAWALRLGARAACTVLAARLLPCRSVACWLHGLQRGSTGPVKFLWAMSRAAAAACTSTF
jgi:hypothetical protein